MLVSLLAITGAVEALLRGTKIADRAIRHAELQARFEQAIFYSPWGWSFRPNVDAIWDYTGQESVPVRVRWRTLPIPGAADYGMRDDGWNPHAKRTIVALGDSFTFGATVEAQEIWCERIERRHAAVDLLNLSSGGGVAKAVAEYRFLRDRLPEHAAVVYALWLGNEFLDNAAFAEGSEQVESHRRTHEARLLRFAVTSRSRLLLAGEFAWSAVQARFERRQFAWRSETQSFWDARFGNFVLSPRNQILLAYARSPVLDQVIVKGIQETRRGLIELKELAAPRRVLIVLFPFKEQLYFDLVRSRVSDLDIMQPNRVVLEICRDVGLTCSDTTPQLSHPGNERLFWDYDMHFTPLGQMRAAEVAETSLRSLGLLN